MNDENKRRDLLIGGSREEIFGKYVRPIIWIDGDRRHIDYPWRQFYIDSGVPLPYFWISMVRNLLGREWLGGSESPPAEPAHLVHQWFSALTEQWSRDRQIASVSDDGTFDSIPEREMYAIGRLGYEAFILAANNIEMPDVLKALRRPTEFLSARFELAVGAFLSVAGLSVEFLERKGRKTPDIRAFSRILGQHLHIEVKRKHRERSSDPSPISAEGEWRLKVRDRVLDALDQLKDYSRPWVVFVDVDLGFPMPTADDSATREFWDAVISEIDGHVPDVLVLAQVPYNSDGAYEPGRGYQFLFTAHAESEFAENFRRLAPQLAQSESQFNRIPKEWDHLARTTDGPGSK